MGTLEPKDSGCEREVAALFYIEIYRFESLRTYMYNCNLHCVVRVHVQ